MNPIAIRLLNQQLIAPQFNTPTEVVRYMGAMQAQEYRMMRWAVAMRTRRPSFKAFKKAFDEGQIIRLHLMRGTWQLVSAEDYWSMIDLFAPKAIAVTKGWMSSNKIAIPDEELMRVREILVRTAAEKRSVTKDDFVLALAEKGTKTKRWLTLLISIFKVANQLHWRILYGGQDSTSATVEKALHSLATAFTWKGGKAESFI